MENKDYKFLNIARAFAIIMMVIGHVNTNNIYIGYIQKFFLLFHMPLFIFISGYLYKDRNFESLKDLVKYLFKRIKKLYIFYLKYELIFYFLTNLFLKIGWLTTESGYYSTTIVPISNIKQVIVDVIKIALCMGRVPFCGAFWFIITLIFVTIFISSFRYLSNKFKNKNIEKICVIVLFLVGCILNYLDINIPRISPAFSGTIIFYLGMIFYKSKFDFNKISFFFISFIVLCLCVGFNVAIALNSNSIGNPILFILISLAGVYFTFYISIFIENKCNILSKFFNYIGKNTLPIMAYHFISFKLIMMLEYFIGRIDYSSLVILTGNPNANSLNGVYEILIYILYVLAGVFIPLIFNYVICKVKVKLHG